MDFSFVGSGNPLKRKAAADTEQPVSKPAAPVASTSSQAQQSQARPRVQLPSLQQVQAAQRSQSGPNLFQASTSASSSSHQPAATSSASWATTSRPDVSLPRVASLSAQGSGVFAQHSSTDLRHATSASQQLPSTSNPPLRQMSYPQPQQHQAPSYVHGARPPLSGSHSGSLSYRQPVSHQQATMVNPNAIFVSKRQEGNPVLKHIRNVRWQFADIIPDYQLGQNACAVFLSLRFHLLKPEYVHHRIKELQRSFRLRLLICHIDVEDVVEPLAQVIKAALLNEVTLICGWSPEECARYLETYKSYETKPADAIQGRTDEDYISRLNSALTTVRGVNKTDVLTLGATFKTVTSIMQASMEQLATCPGLGPTKVKRLHETFHEPFRKVVRQQRLAFAPSQPAEIDADEKAGPSQQMSAFANVSMEDAKAAAVEPLLQDSVLETPMDDINDDPDGDFEVDL
ncbi:hypothetical protein WJX77_006298 [Trebouxia sp. C0004]